MGAATKIFLFTLIVAICHIASSADYCDKTLCKRGDPHIGCRNTGKLGSLCKPGAQSIPMTKDLRALIVNKHNELRNKVAKGYDKFKPATRMATMQWNEELAKLAELNVIKCDFNHDKCRNTPTFKFSGQNLAMNEWENYDFTVKELIDENIRDWFDEYPEASMAHITSYPSDKTISRAIGHFTAIMQDKSTHVGCAALRQQVDKDVYEQYLTCNYAYTNMISRPVYDAGKAASKCKTGTNPTYKFLCSTKEVY